MTEALVEAALEEHVMDVILGVAKSISKSGEGGLIVLAERADVEGLYETHYPQFTSSSPIVEKGMSVVLEKLATIDGAMIVSPRGELISYGARLLRSTTLPGFGTRHAAASGITEGIPAATAVLISEESSWIKIFQNGAIVLRDGRVGGQPERHGEGRRVPDPGRHRPAGGRVPFHRRGPGDTGEHRLHRRRLSHCKVYL